MQSSSANLKAVTKDREKNLLILISAYPIAADLSCGARGTRTRMVVPACSLDSIDKRPSTSFSRSFMLVSPSPCPLIAFSGSKPIPESWTISSIPFDTLARDTSNRCVPLCTTVRFAAELGYDATVVKDAIADYADELMRTALVTNLPNYASAIVSADEIVDSMSSLKTLAIGAEH